MPVIGRDSDRDQSYVADLQYVQTGLIAYTLFLVRPFFLFIYPRIINKKYHYYYDYHGKNRKKEINAVKIDKIIFCNNRFILLLTPTLVM